MYILDIIINGHNYKTTSKGRYLADGFIWSSDCQVGTSLWIQMKILIKKKIYYIFNNEIMKKKWEKKSTNKKT